MVLSQNSPACGKQVSEVVAPSVTSRCCEDGQSLKDADIVLDPASVDVLVNLKYYCRESGVRNLKKHIDKVHRKSLKIVEGRGEDAFPEAFATRMRGRKKFRGHHFPHRRKMNWTYGYCNLLEKLSSRSSTAGHG
jgi:ATP-dependent Lon protease